jgi:hypothetical protein
VSEIQIYTLLHIQTRKMEFLLTVPRKHEEIRETVRMGCLEDKGKGDKEEATHVYYD